MICPSRITSIAHPTASAHSVQRSFDFLDEKLFLQLYKSMVRPRLEYGHVMWDPATKHLKQEVEDVQRTATRLIPSLKGLSYKERLATLQLPALEHRRLRGDLIEVFKYLHSAYKVEKPNFDLAVGKSQDTRGHCFKLAKHQHGKGKGCSLRDHFFTERVCNEWNSLPEAVVKATSANAFKTRLDRFWTNRGSVYDPDSNC